MFNTLNVVMIGIYIMMIPILIHSVKCFYRLFMMVSETEEYEEL